MIDDFIIRSEIKRVESEYFDSTLFDVRDIL